MFVLLVISTDSVIGVLRPMSILAAFTRQRLSAVLATILCYIITRTLGTYTALMFFCARNKERALYDQADIAAIYVPIWLRIVSEDSAVAGLGLDSSHPRGVEALLMPDLRSYISQ